MRESLKQLRKILGYLKESWVFAEGKRDKEALARMGCTNVLTVSGNLRQSAEGLKGNAGTVVVLTDLDRRGNELAMRAKEELEGLSIRADMETRKKLGRILRLKYFEDLARKYEEFMQKANERRIE